MQYEKKSFQLLSGITGELRSAEPEDASQMLLFLRATTGESYFLMRYPEEITLTIAEEAALLRDFKTSAGKLMLTAWTNGEIAGTCGIEARTDRIKVAHRAGFGISVKKRYWGCGIGSLLLTEILMYAKKRGYEQIELGVFADNERALHLYHKFGFTEWGRTPNAYKLQDGTYRDEINMGLFLGNF